MNGYKNSSNLGITRRQFAQLLGAAGALGLVEKQTLARVLVESKRNLGYLANRTAGAEGTWELKQVEGKVPKALDPQRFIRIHRAVLLNIDYVDEVHAWFGGRLVVRLRDGKRSELTVARDRVKALKSGLRF